MKIFYNLGELQNTFFLIILFLFYFICFINYWDIESGFSMQNLQKKLFFVIRYWGRIINFGSFSIEYLN